MPPVSGQETIAAVATPAGRGGVGIVRLSGPAVMEIASRVLGTLPEPRRATYCSFIGRDGEVLDRGLALLFPVPNSFTGEDVLELQAHGGPVLLDMLMERALGLGARAAEPGEFTRRAFLNGRLDLAQAEAIADLIDSGSRQAARSAVRSLQGEFSKRVHALVEALTELRTFVEADIDFSDEDLDLLSDEHLSVRLERLHLQLDEVLAGAYQGRLLRDGMTLVIAGRPNVGKSSLLNRLAGRDSAIVTEIPGTTRDLLREQIDLDGMPLHIVDTAGLRDTKDQVERIGVERAREAIAEADAVLLLVDDGLGYLQEDETIRRSLPADPELLLVHNKCDLSGRPAAIHRSGEDEVIYLSAKSGEGTELLREHLKGMMGFTGGEGLFMARQRHLEALRAALGHMNAAKRRQITDSVRELLADDLCQAQQELGRITGEVSSDELLGRIFSTFCIGK